MRSAVVYTPIFAIIVTLVVAPFCTAKQDQVVQPAHESSKKATPVKKKVEQKKIPQPEHSKQVKQKHKVSADKKTAINSVQGVDKVVAPGAQKKDTQPIISEQAHASLFGDIPAGAYDVDRVIAKIYYGEDAVIVLASDVKPALDGMPRTKDDIFFERLVCLDAKKYKMGPDEEEIDKDIANIQKQHNITSDQLKQVLKSSGYTYEEGRNELATMRIMGQLIDFKIKSKLVVPDKDIEAYYNEHPETEEASYHIAKTFVPYSTTKLSADFFDELDAMVKNKNKVAHIEWQEPFWIDHSALAKDKMFITQMEPGEMAGPYDVGDGYEIYELVAKKEERLRTLKERHAQIANMLRKPKYDELLAEYKTNLLASATIKHF